MTEREQVLHDIKVMKRKIFDLAINIATIYVRSLAISIIIWIVLCFIFKIELNKLGMVIVVITSIISSTILCRYLFASLSFGLQMIKVVKKVLNLLDEYQSFKNIPDSMKTAVDKDIYLINLNANNLKNKLDDILNEEDNEK